MNADTIVDRMPTRYRWATAAETEQHERYRSVMVQVRRPEHGPDATDLAIHDEAAQVFAYAAELVAAGFDVWHTFVAGESGGWLTYRAPDSDNWGTLQRSYFEGWQHLMPIKPSREYGSSMHIGAPLEVFTVEAARQCASPTNRNDVIGTHANAHAPGYLPSYSVQIGGKA